MRSTDLLNLIECLALNDSAASLPQLLMLSSNKDPEIRMRALEALSQYKPSKNVLSVFRERLNDTDELVRITAIEALGNYKDTKSISKLIERLKDTSNLVKESAIISLGQMQSREIVISLEDMYLEACDSEKLSLAIALYHNNKRKYLQEILQFLDHSDYRLRCAAANLLVEFSVDEDVALVIKTLKNRLNRESAASVISSFKSAIHALS